jgi:hypothetical protein
MAKFKPFKVPVDVEDLPLVTHAGKQFKCSGCGELIPEGFWITEVIEDGMIVGMSMRVGADGAFVHACGKGGQWLPNT